MTYEDCEVMVTPPSCIAPLITTFHNINKQSLYVPAQSTCVIIVASQEFAN